MRRANPRRTSLAFLERFVPYVVGTDATPEAYALPTHLRLWKTCIACMYDSWSIHSSHAQAPSPRARARPGVPGRA